MQCYTELCPPTAVSHSISLPFTSNKSTNLVVAKTSLLQIFDFKSIVTEAASNQFGDNDVLQDLGPDAQDFTGDMTLQKLEYTTKLLLVGEYPLSGTVSSLGRVKILNSKLGTEALLVAFRDAKISLVQWNQERNTISTVSIHYYENSLSTSPWAPELINCPCYLSVDPNNRCAVLRFGPRQIAILPFRQVEDDLAEEDYDPELDGPREAMQIDKVITNGDSGELISPYAASFVLSLTTLDSDLIYPIHLAFLYEYREPTFGVLSAVRAPTYSANLERRDIVSYKVFALDLEQKASTTILSVSNLPTDISRIVALSLPVGGALLIGNNELIHIDQSGRSTGLAVNIYAKQSTNFTMNDQSQLNLKLEGCAVESISEAGDLLLVTSSGRLAIISFVLDGRSVGRIGVSEISSIQGGDLVPGSVSCASSLVRGKIFLGNQENDSLLLGWSRKTAAISSKKPHVDAIKDDDDFSLDEDDMEEEDDIYGAETTQSKVLSKSTTSEPVVPENLIFRVHDRLPNLAPVGDAVFNTQNPSGTLGSGIGAQMVYPNGKGKDGGLIFCHRDVLPKEVQKLEVGKASAAWSFHAKSSSLEGLASYGAEAQLSANASYHRFIIVSQETDEESGESLLYSITSNDIKPIEQGDFDTEGSTVDVGIIANGTWIVHAKTSELRCYNYDFGLEQIVPMGEETVEGDLSITRVSFCDPYISVLRDDASIMILRLDAKLGELVEISGKGLLDNEWLCGSFYKPTHAKSGPQAVLTTSKGGLRIFELPNLDVPIYTTDALPSMPGIITSEFVTRRNAAREELAEVVMADIGDSTMTSQYLVVQTIGGEIVIYQPFHYPSPAQNYFQNLRWLKLSQPKVSQPTEAENDYGNAISKRPALKVIENLRGYSTVAGSWPAPFFILKEASNLPKVVNVGDDTIKSIAPFHTDMCDQGFMTVDSNGTLRTRQLPSKYRYGDSGWAAKKIRLEEEVSHVCYYEKKGLYAVATNKKKPFKLPEDDNHKEWLSEDTTLPPHINQSYIKLLYPQNWTVLDTLELEPGEVILSMSTANLSVSEHLDERRPFVCVGTMVVQGEDQQARGKIIVLDVPDVVPEPGFPETGHKFRAVAREDVKGGVTALAEIGPTGTLVVAQGQKCLVRGLIEKDKLVPVAFMDVQCYITVARVLQGTGMFLLGDVSKGLWFNGYTEEPFKMAVFSKGPSRMEVIAAEFLPHEKQLYIIVGDADKNIHVLQYDPENPKSLAGRRLIHKSTFHSGHFPVSMHLLTASTPPPTSQSRAETPNSEESYNPTVSTKAPLQQVLLTTQSGALSIITPIDELMYLRLNTLQTYLTTQLDHPCGLNPRGYRAAESERTGIKGVLDGSVLKRWNELPKQRRVDVCGRMGVDEESVWQDLGVVCGSGLRL